LPTSFPNLRAFTGSATSATCTLCRLALPTLRKCCARWSAILPTVRGANLKNAKEPNPMPDLADILPEFACNRQAILRDRHEKQVVG